VGHPGEAKVIPTYAYRCADCGKEFEVVETISEHASAKPKCPGCGAERVAPVPTRFYAKTAKKS
jgi:putative FmdB family regulatory protein